MASFEQALLALSGNDILGRRNEAASIIKSWLTESRSTAEAELLKTGHGTACAETLSRTEDQIVKALFTLASKLCAKGKDLGLAIVATGGYGRGTLAPGSDIDLLFLLPAQLSDEVNAVVEFMLYAMWDARQKVGHATRNIDDCLKLAKTDNTILTSILESRFICGHQDLFEKLSQRFKTEIVGAGAKKFVTGKLAERDARHAKSGESRYAVEPDLKDGKGGLRDLHTLFWIAKFIFNANSPGDLADRGAFSKEELARFQKCEDFLWAVRCHLHFIAGRGEEKLSFDRQAEIAERLHYHAHGGLMAVERFMRHYFLIAKEVGDLTRIFCASLEERHLKDAARLSRIFARFLPRRRQQLPRQFKLENGRVSLAVDDAFTADPINLLRIFKAAGDAFAEIHPDALKLIRKSLRLVDDKLRNDAEASRIFLEILCDSATPETLLRMLNEAGVLGRFIPDFGKIVAMMQFNMYHHYTVDEHLIRSVGVLSGIESGALKEDHPLASSIFPTITSRRALYVATLLHDIAKGRPEHHSVEGERIALELCPRLGLAPDETELVGWLIRQHLVMSETSQMRDLNDFKTILDFSQIVQSPERLKLLLILTVADIRAVGPGVWNGWKGQLLRTLYLETEPVLSGGHTAATRKDRVIAAQDAFFAKLGGTPDRQQIAARHYDAYWLNVSTESQLHHHALMARAVKGEVLTDVKTNAFSGITEITIFSPDHPRLLALITGACAAAGGNIIGAHIFTTTDGMALDTILITREFNGEEDELRKGKRVCETIKRVLHGQTRLKDQLARLPDMPDRAKAFTVAPRVAIDNASSNKNTIVEINGLDRVGLLYALTEALFHLNLNIASAHITTFGEKAVDVFYVTDLTGAKITSENRIRQIESALLAVLSPQPEKVAIG